MGRGEEFEVKKSFLPVFPSSLLLSSLCLSAAPLSMEEGLK